MEGNNNVSDHRVAYRGVSQNWVPPLGATTAMHGHAQAAQPDFGGTALVASTVPPPPVANNLGFARVLARSQSSSERTVTDLNPKVSDDEEEVSLKARIEVDTELKLG
ncbi:Phospho-N-acetylmuramoyl-pentapeptide-transferase [Actinidia chinensis var. chinensis]|uniref:Phospho-N-acetylmuramoyl-pentapeptide-transferase n=1 Tax=Actinidia chinensis var. chinensis TaxID=1590841 RepID=A0A2R6QGZ3_ACTCC|nr:Phospho-N-acetylmuramoyl-pentapeptide-transferase [Actinidia chinensis var. chinensis]